MRIRIIGSAAGGGVPQWNCRCPNCAAARAGSPDVQPRTQSSVAVSADGSHWFLLNVSPDIRQQIIAFPALGPGPSPLPPLPQGERGDAWRGTAIAGCVLTDAELDHVTGLLLLREGRTGFSIHCTATVRRWLNDSFPVEPILTAFSTPLWTDLLLERPVMLCLPDGSPSGLRVRAFELDPHVPRFVRAADMAPAGSVVGLQVEDIRTGGRLVYAPCIASLGNALKVAASGADAVLIDGTFWDDEEPRRHGIGARRARAMGHVPVSGPDGSLDWLAGLKASHRAYIHINNTNPMLNRAGPEFRMVCDRGVRVGADGDEVDL